MNIIRTGTIVLCLYVSGIILYSSLFIFSSNQLPLFQGLKVFAAAAHCLVFVIPVFLAQSRHLLVRILGYAILIAYFAYVFFLVGYFMYFGFVPEIYALGLASTGDMAEVSNHYFAQIFGLREGALILCALVFFYLVPRQKLPARALLVLALPGVLFGVNLVQYGAPGYTKVFGNASLIRRFGLPAFYYLSVQERLSFTSNYLAEETPFPGKLSQIVYDETYDETYDGAYDGALGADQPTSNAMGAIQKVVLVQIESFDPEAIDARLNGTSVMPFVSGLRDTACREFTNFHTIKSVGGSSDSEFSVATGLLPSRKLQSIRHADFTQVETLYDILSASGVTSYFAHNNNIGFYGRNLAYTQMQDSVTASFLTPGETISERAFARDGLAAALATSERLFYYFFNFQSHGPFQGYSQEATDRFALSGLTDIKKNYLATMYDVDQTIAEMFALQQADFERGDSLFVLTADHPSHLHADGSVLANSRIPLLLCHSTFSGTQVDAIGSTVDLFPTILEAFGVAGEDTAIANSLLHDTPRVVLFPTGHILRRRADDALDLSPCTSACQPYFDFTDQFIRVSN